MLMPGGGSQALTARTSLAAATLATLSGMAASARSTQPMGTRRNPTDAPLSDIGGWTSTRSGTAHYAVIAVQYISEAMKRRLMRLPTQHPCCLYFAGSGQVGRAPPSQKDMRSAAVAPSQGTGEGLILILLRV